MLSRSRWHASKEHLVCDPRSFRDHKHHDPLDSLIPFDKNGRISFLSIQQVATQKQHLAPLNSIHSILHGSCISEEPCTLVTYHYTVQHRMKQVWLQGAADGITKSSTCLCVAVRLSSTIHTNVCSSTSRSRNRSRTYANLHLWNQKMKRLANPGGSETAGKISIDNLHFKICTIIHISSYFKVCTACSSTTCLQYAVLRTKFSSVLQVVSM